MPTNVLSDGLHNAFPGIVRRVNGERVIVYRAGASHLGADGRVLARVATGQGQAYGSEIVVLDHATHDSRDPEINEIATPQGMRLICGCFAHTGGSAILNGLRVLFSDDGGITWSAPIVPADGFAGWVAESAKIIQLPTGALLWPVYGTDATEQLIEVLRSDDYGQTWTATRPWVTSPIGNMQEPNICLMADGSLLMMIRTGSGGDTYESVSTDSGQTWSAPVSVTVHSGRPHCNVMPDDSVVAILRREQAATSEPMIAFRSGSWGSFTQLEPGWTARCTYASTIVDEDGNCEYLVSLESGSVADLWTGVVALPPVQSVAAQSPASGTTVAPGSAVSLTLTNPPPITQNYVGDSLARATMRITTAGLVVQ